MRVLVPHTAIALALVLVRVLPSRAASTSPISDATACSAPAAVERRGYFAAADAHIHSGGQRAPPGSTRTAASAQMYHVLAPDSRVYGSNAPGWIGHAPAAAVVAPALGAHFVMYIVRAARGAVLDKPTAFGGSIDGLERFFYVLTGTLHLTELVDGAEVQAELTPGDFAYIAPLDLSVMALVAKQPASFIRTSRNSPYRRPSRLTICPSLPSRFASPPHIQVIEPRACLSALFVSFTFLPFAQRLTAYTLTTGGSTFAPSLSLARNASRL
jgi:uncharacterized RmlC-like cupin family protein